MPAPEAPERGGVSSVVAALPWAGVGVAVLGALLALVADGGPLTRLATLLAALAAVLVGLHQALRRPPSRAELDDTVYAEADAVRADARADITTAVQAVHRAFGEKLQILYEQLDALRAEGPHPAAGRPAARRESGA
ncbi:MAG TPA: hypothetical protein VNV66_22305, partial [Pilimelia sp.]|nr:hypothetical protein [Pilimelia sp.]